MLKRASIFQSFDALKGFRELLLEQEKIKVDKVTLSEDALNTLDNEIHLIKEGMIVKVTYYDKDGYYLKEGVVSKINFEMKLLQIVKQKINMKDIVKIECEEIEKFMY